MSCKLDMLTGLWEPILLWGQAECRRLWSILKFRFSRGPDHRDRLDTETWRDEGSWSAIYMREPVSCKHWGKKGLFKRFKNDVNCAFLNVATWCSVDETCVCFLFWFVLFLISPLEAGLLQLQWLMKCWKWSCYSAQGEKPSLCRLPTGCRRPWDGSGGGLGCELREQSLMSKAGEFDKQTSRQLHPTQAGAGGQTVRCGWSSPEFLCSCLSSAASGTAGILLQAKKAFSLA